MKATSASECVLGFLFLRPQPHARLQMGLGCVLAMLLASASANAEEPRGAGEAPVTKKAKNPADRNGSSDSAGTELSKKDQRLQDKVGASPESAKRRWQKELRRRIGKRPAPVVNIFNTWTHETIAVELDGKKFRGGVRGAKRRLAAARRAQNKEASWHLRCHFTNEPTEMDARLFAVLVEAAHEFSAPRIEIISGFRAPKYNLMLRKKGRQVARTSHHTRGEAVDFRLPGVPTSRLRKWAIKLKLGGVGYYASSGFVHVDIGKPRTWRGE